MKRMIVASTACLVLLPALPPTKVRAEQEPPEKWAGVDETVVEKFAEEAGRPAHDPIINVGEGDMLLFCFLLAGAVGGFVLGYACRALFGKDGAAASQTTDGTGI